MNFSNVSTAEAKWGCFDISFFFQRIFLWLLHFVSFSFLLRLFFSLIFDVNHRNNNNKKKNRNTNSNKYSDALISVGILVYWKICETEYISPSSLFLRDAEYDMHLSIGFGAHPSPAPHSQNFKVQPNRFSISVCAMREFWLGKTALDNLDRRRVWVKWRKQGEILHKHLRWKVAIKFKQWKCSSR